jgi:hypothetical protein
MAEVLALPPTAASHIEEFELLKAEARQTIAAMVEEIVDHAALMDGAAIQMKAHRLAGLSAQFYATEVAECADRLEAAVIAGEALTPALAEMARALVRFREKV